MASAVDVSVEALQESQIQEVTLDGQEIYKPSLSMSENLTRLAHKIDFSKDESEGKGKPTSEGDADVDDEQNQPSVPFQASQWPWDSVRNKLKTALTEMSVLSDVLHIAKEKRYMVLDPVSTVPSQEPQDPKYTQLLIGKKKSLSTAANILINGADRLRRSQEVMAKRQGPEFHTELFKLRQNWRLKKVGSVILGDLTYKSAGSRFWQNGTFEVKKSEVDTVDITDSPQPGHSAAPRHVLQVVVPSELEGVAYIQVAIKKVSGESTDLANAELNLQGSGVSGSMHPDSHWQRKLEAAQNVIFCKEVFAQLAREAVKINSKVPHMVVGNQIFSHLFPGIQLSVALCHYTDKDKKAPPSPPRPEHNHVLEHSLHQLLKEAHFKNMFHPMPHPVTAVLGMSKRRRIAGPQGFSRTELLEMTHSETLLEQIVAQARHIVVWQKAIFVVDEVARTIQDPHVAAHWSNITSATESLIKIHITSAGYDNQAFRTPMSLHINVDALTAILKDGKVIKLSYEDQELKDLLLGQIAQHQLSTLQALTRMMGWHVLSTNSHVGVGDMEPIGNAMSLVIASPNGQRVLSVKSGPISGIKVSVQKNGTNNISSILDKKWQDLGGPFEPVHLERIEGKNFINKMELLMACLSPGVKSSQDY